MPNRVKTVRLLEVVVWTIGTYRYFPNLMKINDESENFSFYSSCGYYIEPTIVLTKDPFDKIMTEEIFGPILTVYVYKDADLEKTMKLVDCATPYALTGAVFAKDL